VASLFASRDLSDYVQYTVEAAAAVIAERVAWGWLAPVLGLTERPDPVPAEVFSWAIELGAIAHETPNGSVTGSTKGAVSDTYGAPRRQQILAEAAAWSAAQGATSSGPQGAFPAACWWPDPAVPR
jgi:hypothetical protein